jgi:glucose/arabinose dehydrogenase
MRRSTLVMWGAAAVLAVGALATGGCAAPPATVGPSTATPVPGAPSGAATSSAAATSTTTLPAWPRVKLVKVASGFDHPLYVTSDGTGDGKLYVVEQTGKIRVIGADGKIEPRPLLDISSMTAPGGERGLLGLAFSPKFAKDKRFYVDYTDLNGDTKVALSVANPPGAIGTIGPPLVILTVRQPYPNHNGGCLQFGPDGYLYIGMGDGGSAGDPGNRAQDSKQLLGKMLRIDVSSSDYSHPYTFASGNPFTIVAYNGYAPALAQMGDNRGEIFLLGLRNPWRFSFDRKTGELYIGDVGQDLWEEIDVLPKDKGGFNLGWNLWEGNHPYPPGSKPSTKGFTFPVLEYPHPYGEAVIGGYVYRGSKYPQWDGLYFYGDEVKGWIAAARSQPSRSLFGPQRVWETRKVLDTGFPLSSFGTDDAGELYACDLTGGAVYRLEPAK